MNENILVSEFTSNDQNRIACVYDNIKSGKFWIHFIDKSYPEKCHIKVFDIEEELFKVEDLAESWVDE